jgi:hypothetical protein
VVQTVLSKEGKKVCRFELPVAQGKIICLGIMDADKVPKAE